MFWFIFPTNFLLPCHQILFWLGSIKIKILFRFRPDFHLEFSFLSTLYWSDDIYFEFACHPCFRTVLKQTRQACFSIDLVLVNIHWCLKHWRWEMFYKFVASVVLFLFVNLVAFLSHWHNHQNPSKQSF